MIVHPGDVVPQDYVEQVTDQLANVALKTSADDWNDDYLVNREAEQDEYLESLFRDRNAVYLD